MELLSKKLPKNKNLSVKQMRKIHKLLQGNITLSAKDKFTKTYKCNCND